MVLCRVYDMFCAVFVALIGRILWPMEKGCFRDSFESKRRVLELPRTSLALYCVEAMLLCGWARNCSIGYAIAWVSTQLRSPNTLSNLQLYMPVSFSPEL